jgi:cell division septation protein DedD
VKEAPAAAAKTVPASAKFQPPKMLKGAVVLQIAALTHESDALAMADVLQQKKFPSFVVTPTTDNFYRVQVGPYPDQKSADAAKSALDRAGFKAIIKR